MHQLRVELLLQAGQTPAHRGLGHPEMPAGGGEAISPNYLHKRCDIVFIRLHEAIIVAFLQPYVN
jgi:hypothetical protein